MFFRRIVSLSFVVLLAGCASEEAKKKKAEEKKEQPLKRQVEDPAFLAFTGRLRTAVTKKDLPTLSSMMTADFGYRWDNPPVGDNVFTYWDLNDTWPVLQKTLREKFLPHDDYLVAEFQGYRAGIRLVTGSWKFAYFVPDEARGPQ